MADMEYAEVFREEAVELLQELESSLLELEKKPADLKLVGRVFRAMHTIKGSGAMFGFDDIADFTHHVETVFDEVRDGVLPVSKELIDLTLASRDHIQALLDAAVGGSEADSARGQEIITSFKVLSASISKASDKPVVTEDGDVSKTITATESTACEDITKESLTHYRIHFQPAGDFFETGGKVEPLLEELQNLGDSTVFIHDQAEGAQPLWEILLTTDKGLNSVKDVFVFAESSCKIKVTTIAVEGKTEFQEHRKLGEILVERGELSSDELFETLDQQKPLGELLVEADMVCRSKIKAALAEQKLTSSKEKTGKIKGIDSIRVAADKLDQLINLVGELVVTQARLSQAASRLKDQELLEPVEDVERLTAELRDCVLSVRMLPIGTTFSRFKRLVRDLAGELGKEVSMITEGAETELDKNVIDQLGDPLVHLIRNSIDHGIEPPAARESLGKPRQGTVRLSAHHVGANVIITVADDGKGLNAELLRKKAVEKRFIRAEDELTEKEILNLIFKAGFSMAKNVTSVSGRGVGMDVVKSAIDRLKGSVAVTSSIKGEGTTITISLPLTLAIIEGLLVRAGQTHFVLPLMQVEECVELTSKDIARFHDRRLIKVRDQLTPYVRLRDFFYMKGGRPDLEQMVIVRVNGERTGFVLDDVVGEHQTVIKKLGWVYRNTIGLSGSTILGNGEVALILDVPDIIKYAWQEEMTLVAKQQQKK